MASKKPARSPTADRSPTPPAILSCCSATRDRQVPPAVRPGPCRLRSRPLRSLRHHRELAEAADERRLSRLVGRCGRLDLLCLDELGYVQLHTRGSELLFQILTETRGEVEHRNPTSHRGPLKGALRFQESAIESRH